MSIIPNFYKTIKNNISKNINYYTAIRTGEIIADNGDGTYDVKIANANSAIPDIETMYYDDIFSIGEIVDIGFEYDNKDSPKIMGHSKKIAQEPKEVEVDYSSGGVQTVTTTIYGDIADGCIVSSESTSFSTVHNNDGSGYDIYSDVDEIYIGQMNVGGIYSIARGFIFFDSSSIPTNAIIITAVLNIYFSLEGSEDYYLVVQNGQPDYPHNPIDNTDYNYLYYNNNGGQININLVPTNAYSTITLNSNGKAWINKGGITKLCLRISRDIASIAPIVDNLDIVYIYSANKGTGYWPYLTITYII